jgi:serine/threonine protein kinase
MIVTKEISWHPQTVKMLCENGTFERAHPHIVHILLAANVVHDISEGGGKFVIQMELCEGTLRGYLKYLHSNGRKLREKDILHILNQILDGLFYCHSKGITHGNLKPSNSTIDLRTVQN